VVENNKNNNNKQQNNKHTCLTVKSFPTLSRKMLKKHSTSSVVEDRGFAGGSP
jgi:hypothetical protein